MLEPNRTNRNPPGRYKRHIGGVALPHKTDDFPDLPEIPAEGVPDTEETKE